MGCCDSKPESLPQALVSDFAKYYKHIRRKLKVQNFRFKSPNGEISFKKKLTDCTGVNNNVAKAWITLYIDYMILAAWTMHSDKKIMIYPPYPIQQVLRLHTTFPQNYLAFNDLITQGKGVIPFAPFRLAARQNLQEYMSLRESYNWAKDFLKEKLYHNPKAHKSEPKKLLAAGVWEDFEMTLMQCEFSFCFIHPEAKEMFQKVLAEHPDEMAMASQDPQEILRVIKALRNFLGVGDLASNNSLSQFTPVIENAQCSQEEQHLLKKLNDLPFSNEFVNVLALEQRISVDEACKWIEEYKKFLFLVYVSNEEVIRTPSEAVEQVWCLHMQFTDTYQNDMKIITPIHYRSWKGAEVDPHEFQKFYNETINLYASRFGLPDDKIWPHVERRFEENGKLASYYLFFARKCLTEEQKAKVLEKYKEYAKNKKEKRSTDSVDNNNYPYYDNYYGAGLGFDALILGLLLFSDPFDFNDYGHYDVYNAEGGLDEDQLDDQSVNNYTVDNFDHGMNYQYGGEEENNKAGWLGGGDDNGDDDDGGDDGGD